MLNATLHIEGIHTPPCGVRKNSLLVYKLLAQACHWWTCDLKYSYLEHGKNIFEETGTKLCEEISPRCRVLFVLMTSISLSDNIVEDKLFVKEHYLTHSHTLRGTAFSQTKQQHTSRRTVQDYSKSIRNSKRLEWLADGVDLTGVDRKE